MDQNKINVPTKKVLKRLFQYMKPHRIGLYFALAFIVIASIFNSFGPFILGKATDTLAQLVMESTNREEGVRAFIQILVTLSLVYILYAVFKYISTYILVKVSQRTIYDLRKAVDSKLKKLPLNYFDTNTYGDVLSRMTNDIDTISNSLQQSLDQIVTAITTIICIFAMMLYISPILTFIGVITVPLALFFSMKIAGISQKYFKQQQDIIGDMNGYVEEMYSGHNIISAYGTEEKTIVNFENTNEELFGSGWRSQFLASTLMPITQAMTNLGYVAVVVVSGGLVINGRMTIGMIQSFIQYLRQFSQPINQTVQIANVLQSTTAATLRVFEYIDETEEVKEEKHPQYPEKIDGSVVFEHVQFGYVPYHKLMHDVNLKVNPGENVAIVGPTGAGKTTLINLLLRFYDVNSGAILLSGVDIRKMSKTKLREAFGMVLQDSWLFTGSIMENIRYGRLDASDEEVIVAARGAKADHFIQSLPGGYQFQLSEGAANLAQGERQLLTIARAILSNSPIMILDEATSSVDTRTEVLIQSAMKQLMKGRTSFVIAHRLSTIKDADIIIYMENGDIKETGKHEELLHRNGLYAKLYNSQFTNNNG